MKTFVSSTRNTLSRAFGAMLVSSNKKLKPSETQIHEEHHTCMSDRLIGIALIDSILGLIYWPDTNASIPINTIWCVL